MADKKLVTIHCWNYSLLTKSKPRETFKIVKERTIKNDRYTKSLICTTLFTKKTHFPKTSFIASLRDYYKLRIKHQNLLQLSLSEYEAIKDTLTPSEHRVYKRYHKLLNQLICENTKTTRELDETLKDYPFPI